MRPKELDDRDRQAIPYIATDEELRLDISGSRIATHSFAVPMRRRHPECDHKWDIQYTGTDDATGQVFAVWVCAKGCGAKVGV